MATMLTTMLQMQDAMNTRVNERWREQGFAWYRAIWTECAELMDHYGWKWWKKQVPDVDQVKLELVDIWHFGLSILLLSDNEETQLVEAMARELEIPEGKEDFRELLEEFTLNTLETKAFNVNLFARLMAAVDMDLNELYVRYVGKNVLNFFRQDNGYQEGSYIKNWQGKEDNEHLVEVVAELDTSSHSFKDDIYSALQIRYSLVRAN
jgi:dimeric dUTPase (all-alpha-NTP-PPase superfamily)